MCRYKNRENYKLNATQEKFRLELIHTLQNLLEFGLV